MGKFVEVVAMSNLETRVIITSRVNEETDLEMVVRFTMNKVKELNNKLETFKLESVRAMKTEKIKL